MSELGDALRLAAAAADKVSGTTPRPAPSAPTVVAKINVNSPDAFAGALGISVPAGFASMAEFMVYAVDHFDESMGVNPEATAFVVSNQELRNLNPDNSHPSVAQILGNRLYPTDAPNAGPYNAALTRILPLVRNALMAYAPGEVWR